MMKKKMQVIKLKNIFLHGVLVLFSLIFLLPLLWMISTSLKSPDQIFLNEVRWIPDPIIFDNYVQAFKFVNLYLAFKNTFLLCLLNVVGVVLSSSLAAYAFAVLSWKYREPFFYLTLAIMMLPDMVTLVPQFVLFQKLGWYGSYLPLTVPVMCGNPFFIFLLR